MSIESCMYSHRSVIIRWSNFLVFAICSYVYNRIDVCMYMYGLLYPQIIPLLKIATNLRIILILAFKYCLPILARHLMCINLRTF